VGDELVRVPAAEAELSAADGMGGAGQNAGKPAALNLEI
jgi:hypothetical protein